MAAAAVSTMFVTLAAISLCHGATEDHLRDPSFATGEQGQTPVGWEKYIGSDDFECILDSTNSHSAPFAMKCAGYTDVSGGGAHFALRQLPKGVPVTISAWVKVERYSGRAQFALETINFNPRYNQLQWIDIINTSVSCGWTYVSKTLTIDPAATSLFLTVFLKCNTRIWVDDVQITVAEGATALAPSSRPLSVHAATHRGGTQGHRLQLSGRATGVGGSSSALAPGVYLTDLRDRRSLTVVNTTTR
jgi:hypothetical protein